MNGHAVADRVVAGSPAVLAQLVAWVAEEVLSEQRAHLRVGQQLASPASAAGADLRSGVLQGLPEAAGATWHLHPDPAMTSGPSGVRMVTGRVAAITSVVVPYRRSGAEDWAPIPGAARTRSVPSTCAPEIARSVWIPSGHPVLAGFLLTIEDPHFAWRIADVELDRP